jgi:arylsulfatase A-like enzyme
MQRGSRGVTRRAFFQQTGAAATAAGLSSCALFAKGEKPPNVLFVFGDQHRASALEIASGDRDIHTPHFNDFAREGLRLEACVSNTPACYPYRASLMTGKHCHHTGVITDRVHPEPDKHAFLAKHLRKSGYACGYVGKWQLGPTDAKPGDPARLGFDDGFDCATAAEEENWMKGRGFHGPRGDVDLAIDFLKQQSQADPWCLFLSWGTPHDPFAAAMERAAYYLERDEIQLHPNVPKGVASEFAQTFLPHYYGLIDGMDAEWGRLMREVDRLGFTGDTIVVYSSDHGEMMGSQGLTFKRWPYRESTQVPFLIRWPERIRANSTLSMPFGAPDVFPTLAGLAGVGVPGGLDGLDLSAAFQGQTGAVEQECAYMSMPHGYVPWPGWRGVRTERHVYARTESAPWLLFDLKDDPYEQHNLVDEKPALRGELDGLLMETMTSLGDSWRGEGEPGEEKVGDWAEWAPGGSRQLDQICGGDYPGRQIDVKDVAAWRRRMIQSIGASEL